MCFKKLKRIQSENTRRRSKKAVQRRCKILTEKAGVITIRAAKRSKKMRKDTKRCEMLKPAHNAYPTDVLKISIPNITNHSGALHGELAVAARLNFNFVLRHCLRLPHTFGTYSERSLRECHCERPLRNIT